MGLSSLTCKSLAAGTPSLAQAQARQLQNEVPAWTLQGDAITREFQFKDFSEAMLFVNQVAELAQQQKHHPDFIITYKTVRLTLSTHKIGGLSENDFILAAHIDQLLQHPSFGAGG